MNNFKNNADNKIMKHKSVEEYSNALYNSDLKHLDKNLRRFIDAKERVAHRKVNKIER